MTIEALTIEGLMIEGLMIEGLMIEGLTRLIVFPVSHSQPCIR
jgi:hypothetical protein